MQECPANLAYSHRHVWVDRIGDADEGIVRIGLTHYYVEELPEILSLDLPMVGDEVEIDRNCVHLHTANDIEEMRAPLSGHVHDINREVLDKPRLLHIDAYKNWILELECEDLDEFEILVNSDRYTRYVESL